MPLLGHRGGLHSSVLPDHSGALHPFYPKTKHCSVGLGESVCPSSCIPIGSFPWRRVTDDLHAGTRVVALEGGRRDATPYPHWASRACAGDGYPGDLPARRGHALYADCSVFIDAARLEALGKALMAERPVNCGDGVSDGLAPGNSAFEPGGR